MAPKKNATKNSDLPAISSSDADLEQAIDDLRGVLKSDAEGTLPSFETDFDADEPAAFGGDFATGAGSDFGQESGSFGGSDFAAGDFGGDSFAAAPSGSDTQAPGSALDSNLDLIMDIPIDVQIVLGSSRMQVSGLMALTEGAIIGLDKKIGEPVEIMVNGRRIARGEITVLENDDTRFGVKLIEVMRTRKA